MWEGPSPIEKLFGKAHYMDGPQKFLSFLDSAFLALVAHKARVCKSKRRETRTTRNFNINWIIFVAFANPFSAHLLAAHWWGFSARVFANKHE